MSIILHHAPTSGWELPLPGPPVCEWKSDPMSRIEYICQGPCHRACLAAWLEERVSERIELPRESLISCGSGWVNYYLHWVSWTAKHNLEVALGPDSDDLGPDSDDFEMEDTQMLVDEVSRIHFCPHMRDPTQQHPGFLFSVNLPTSTTSPFGSVFSNTFPLLISVSSPSPPEGPPLPRSKSSFAVCTSMPSCRYRGLSKL
jgi:hypothetical protein